MPFPQVRPEVCWSLAYFVALNCVVLFNPDMQLVIYEEQMEAKV